VHSEAVVGLKRERKNERKRERSEKEKDNNSLRNMCGWKNDKKQPL